MWVDNGHCVEGDAWANLNGRNIKSNNAILNLGVSDNRAYDIARVCEYVGGRQAVSTTLMAFFVFVVSVRNSQNCKELQDLQVSASHSDQMFYSYVQ